MLEENRFGSGLVGQVDRLLTTGSTFITRVKKYIYTVTGLKQSHVMKLNLSPLIIKNPGKNGRSEKKDGWPAVCFPI